MSETYSTLTQRHNICGVVWRVWRGVCLPFVLRSRRLSGERTAAPDSTSRLAIAAAIAASLTVWKVSMGSQPAFGSLSGL